MGGNGKSQATWPMLARWLSASCVVAAFGFAPTNAAEVATVEDTQEQSIVVAKILSSTRQDEPLVIATDNPPSEKNPKAAETSAPSAIVLEPIANVSEYVPVLAEPNSAEPAEGTPGPTENASPQSRTESLLDEVQSDSICFHGVTPGITNRRDLMLTWGEPRNVDTTSPKLKFRFDEFESVYVYMDGVIVDTIEVDLDEPLPCKQLIADLRLDAISPAEILGAGGVVRGRVFPERGVILRFEENSQADAEPQVGEVVLQAIKAESFLLRAQQTRKTSIAAAIADLEEALQLDRTSGEAHWLLSEILLDAGQALEAERQGAEAVDCDPENPLFRLQRAKALRLLARYDLAVEESRRVLESDSSEPIVRAEALHEMGLLAAMGSQEVVERSVPLHVKAIEIADGLAMSEDPNVAAAAQELAIEASLALAVEISKGEWSNKRETVVRWLERASAVAETMIEGDQRNLRMRLKVAVSALAAASSLEKPIDPTLWVEEAEDTVEAIKQLIHDPVLDKQLAWDLGLAYFHAAQIEHLRSKPESALQLGKLAENQLAELAEQRDELPDTSYLMGRLYFQIGAVHAVHRQNHQQACQWYDRAVGRLLNPVPVTLVARPQSHGDALVSMGVSYWEINRRAQAIEVTREGVELIEEAVQGGLLDHAALAVPYNNLAAMYQAQGETESATRYSRLAQQLKQSRASEKTRG